LDLVLASHWGQFTELLHLEDPGIQGLGPLASEWGRSVRFDAWGWGWSQSWGHWSTWGLVLLLLLELSLKLSDLVPYLGQHLFEVAWGSLGLLII
jgi:hypothetical protein